MAENILDVLSHLPKIFYSFGTYEIDNSFFLFISYPFLSLDYVS